mgnify:CR=1 FL=1
MGINCIYLNDLLQNRKENRPTKSKPVLRVLGALQWRNGNFMGIRSRFTPKATNEVRDSMLRMRFIVVV